MKWYPLYIKDPASPGKETYLSSTYNKEDRNKYQFSPQRESICGERSSQSESKRKVNIIWRFPRTLVGVWSHVVDSDFNFARRIRATAPRSLNERVKVLEDMTGITDVEIQVLFWSWHENRAFSIYGYDVRRIHKSSCTWFTERT